MRYREKSGALVYLIKRLVRKPGLCAHVHIEADFGTAWFFFVLIKYALLKNQYLLGRRERAVKSKPRALPGVSVLFLMNPPPVPMQ